MNRRSFFAALSALVVAKPTVRNHFEFDVSTLDTEEMSRFIRYRVMPEIHKQLRPTQYVINGREVSAEEFLHRFH